MIQEINKSGINYPASIHYNGCELITVKIDTQQKVHLLNSACLITFGVIKGLAMKSKVSRA